MASMHQVPFEPRAQVRLGLIGCGGRGLGLLNELLALEGVDIAAVADVLPQATERALQMTLAQGFPPPRTFSGADAWQRLLDCELDIVYIATPWDTHTPYAEAAMRAGKHAAVEVPAAVTLDECWRLVEASEQTRRHCVMLENCCYDYWETLVKHLVFAGKLGTITHAECAYNHDLRSLLMDENSEGRWRRQPYTQRNGNFYPTHGLGPVAQMLKIGSEDAFDFIVSMSSLSAGLAEYRQRSVVPDDPRRGEVYCNGDMNVSLIRTRLGRTVVLQHNTVSPRPYDRGLQISGTRGIFKDYPPRLYIEGESSGEEWLPLDDYRAQWEDPLWTNLGELARKRGGHGGMDFLMNYRLLQVLQQGLPPDSDVYEAVEWSVPGPLSELSVARGSAPVAFPNFRR